MTDIVERLRDRAHGPATDATHADMREAAAEIERLRARRDRLVKRLRDAGLSTPMEALNGDEQMGREALKP